MIFSDINMKSDNFQTLQDGSGYSALPVHTGMLVFITLILFKWCQIMKIGSCVSYLLTLPDQL